jgi:hypothetical protein
MAMRMRQEIIMAMGMMQEIMMSMRWDKK